MSEPAGIRVRVRCFALAADALGRDRGEVALPAGATISDLLDRLCREAPNLAALRPRLLTAVDQDYAPHTRALKDGEEVVLIPPVSGG